VTITSTIPAAIDALVSALRSTLGSSASVIDGPPAKWDPIQRPVQAGSGDNDFKFVFVGASRDGAEVEGVLDFNAAGNVSRNEVFTVNCAIYTTGSDPDIKTRRDDAFALLSVVGNLDPTLNNSVLYSRVSTVTVEQQLIQGEWSNCTIFFGVEMRSYLR
jgi:hypothetical protein